MSMKAGQAPVRDSWVSGPDRSPTIMNLACTVVGDQSTRVGVAFRSDGTAKRGGEVRVTSTDRLERDGR